MALHPGTSRLVGPAVLFWFRLLFALLYLGALGAALFFIILLKDHSATIEILLMPVVWYCVLAFIAFVLLAMCAYDARTATRPPSYARAANILLFSATTLFLSGIPIESTLLSEALYGHTFYNAGNFTLVPAAVDILLASNLEFFYNDIWTPLFVYLIWNGANWASSPTYHADNIKNNIYAGYYIAALVAAFSIHFVFAALIILFTKAYRKVGNGQNTETSNHDNTEMASDNET